MLSRVHVIFDGLRKYCTSVRTCSRELFKPQLFLQEQYICISYEAIAGTCEKLLLVPFHRTKGHSALQEEVGKRTRSLGKL